MRNYLKLRVQISSSGDSDYQRFAVRISLSRYDPMKMQLDLSINDSANALNEAAGLIFGFTNLDDIGQRGAGSNAERFLIDYLVTGIEFRNDEMAGTSKCKHVCRVRIMIRLDAGKSWQQAMV